MSLASSRTGHSPLPAPSPAATPSLRARTAAWRRRLESEEMTYRNSVLVPWRPSRLSGVLEHVLVQACRTVGLDRRGLANVLDVRASRFDVAIPGLHPAFDGYRILQVSDPHYDAHPQIPNAIARAIEGGIDVDGPVDLCVLTGDYRVGHQGSHVQCLAGIAQTVAVADAADGALAVLGNHDCLAMVEDIESLGLRVLLNETTTVQREDAHLAIVGIDDPHRFGSVMTADAIRQAALDHPDSPRIALAHSPEASGVAAMYDTALYLCGHTHAGQVCLPGGVPVITHCRSPRPYVRGLWARGGMTGYTSSGAGASGCALRFFSRSEVAFVTLRSS